MRGVLSEGGFYLRGWVRMRGVLFDGGGVIVSSFERCEMHMEWGSW